MCLTVLLVRVDCCYIGYRIAQASVFVTLSVCEYALRVRNFHAKSNEKNSYIAALWSGFLFLFATPSEP